MLIRYDAIKARWKKHFEEFLNTETRTLSSEEHKCDTETDIVTNGEEDDLTEEELAQAINKTKNGKAPGHDGITPEMIRCLGTQGRGLLLKIINLDWNKTKIPRERKKARKIQQQIKGSQSGFRAGFSRKDFPGLLVRFYFRDYSKRPGTTLVPEPQTCTCSSRTDVFCDRFVFTKVRSLFYFVNIGR